MRERIANLMSAWQLARRIFGARRAGDGQQSCKKRESMRHEVLRFACDVPL